jgi:hypothetical protein
MKTIILNAALIMLCSLLTSTSAHAQMQAKKFDNPQWKTIVFVQFKEGKMDRVREIIRNYFAKAADKAGTPQPSLATELATGEWNMMLVWDMKEGLEQMNWETNPNDVKWMTAMNDIAGGADKAKAILDEWSSLIVRTTSYLGRNF